MSTSSSLGTGLRWGAVLGGFLVLYGLVFRLAGFHYKSLWTWIFYLALPVGGFLAMRSAARGGGARPIFRAAGVGWLTALLGSAVYCLFVYGYNRFVDDSLLRDVRADQVAALTARGLDPAGHAANLERLEAFTQPGAFAIAVFVQLAVVGFLACLAVAAIRRWVL